MKSSKNQWAKEVTIHSQSKSVKYPSGFYFSLPPVWGIFLATQDVFHWGGRPTRLWLSAHEAVAREAVAHVAMRKREEGRRIKCASRAESPATASLGFKQIQMLLQVTLTSVIHKKNTRNVVTYTTLTHIGTTAVGQTVVDVS